jgi:hypothetical protein
MQLDALPWRFAKVERIERASADASYREGAPPPRTALRVIWRWYAPSCYVVIGLGVLLVLFPFGLWAAVGEAVLGGCGISAFLGLGLLTLYFGLRMRLNATVITADDRGVTLAEGPLPPRGSRHFPTDVLDQPFCTRFDMGMGGVASYKHALVLRLSDGSDAPLIESTEQEPEVAQALLRIEMLLEERLGIADRAVGDQFELRP